MNKQRIEIYRLFLFIFLLSIAVLSLIQGCSRGDAEGERVVATVNREPIRLKDFEGEIALRSRQNPAYKITPQAIEGQLNTIIDRKLMVQEAMEMGLTSNEDFVRTIQTFWEQTLIRELIKAKNNEWEKRLFVTEKEVQDYYQAMQNKKIVDLPPLEEVYDQVKRAILEQKQTEALEEWLIELRNEATIEINTQLLDAYLEAESR